MDLSKLSPAPWASWHIEATGSNNWAGKAGVAGLPIESVDRMPVFREADAEFIALARQAFDVMMRRKVYPELFADHWGVRTLRCEHVRGEDPFSALLAYEEWHRENVENQHA